MKGNAVVGGTPSADPSPASTAYRYDAFISYSHDQRQSAITTALQQAIQKFAKPFWKRRAVHLFRDQTNLSANPDLWGSIVEALADSRFLLLIASPKAAGSRWVAKEIDWWISTRGVDTIMIVLTEGSLSWSNDQFSPVDTTALPPPALTAFTAEPTWVDLTWLTTEMGDTGWQGDARFLEAVASISAPLRGTKKEDLFGEDLRRHKQTRMAIGLTIGAISTLLVAAICVAVIAEYQRRVAVRRADEIAASFIWHRLGINQPEATSISLSAQAVWDLCQNPGGVQQAFFRQLSEIHYLADTLAGDSEQISRAFGLRPDQDVIDHLVRPLVNILETSKEADQVHSLARATAAIGPTPQQANEIIDTIVKVTRTTDSPEHLKHLSNDVSDLSKYAFAADKTFLTVDLCMAAEENWDHRDSYRLAAIAQMISSLDIECSSNVAQSVFSFVQILPSYGDILGAPIWPHQVAALSRAILKMSHKPSKAEATQIYNIIVEGISATQDHDDLSIFADLAVDLGHHLITQGQMDVLEPLFQKIEGSQDSNQRYSLAAIIEELVPFVTTNEVQPTLRLLIGQMTRSSDPTLLQKLAASVAALNPSSAEAWDAIAPILNAACDSRPMLDARLLAEGIRALSDKISPAYAAAGLECVVDAILNPSNDDRFRLEAFAEIAAALGHRLDSSEGVTLLGRVLVSFRSTRNPWRLMAMAVTAKALGSTDTQNIAGREALLDAIRQSNDPPGLSALARAVAYLGPSTGEASVALALITDRILENYDYPPAPVSLAFAVQYLAEYITIDAARDSLWVLFDSVTIARNEADFQYLASAIQSLSARLNKGAMDFDMGTLGISLARTSDAKVAEAAAVAIASLMPHDSNLLTANIVELLKWPTTAGPATDALLEVLHERVPDAPGKEAGLKATVAWVEKTYPDIDLDSPPTCPPTVCENAPHKLDWIAWLKGLANPVVDYATAAANFIRGSIVGTPERAPPARAADQPSS